MAPNDDDPVWYVAYGSNCLADRFHAYLTGVQAPGTSGAERGARNSRLPERSEPYVVPRPVRFCGSSRKWGGGVAFLDHHGPGETLGRRYLITRGQFDDVAAQESGRARSSPALADLPVGTVCRVGPGWYDGLLLLGYADGIPELTFTAPDPPAGRRTEPPSAAYLATILLGLCEVHREPVDAIAERLLAAPGVAPEWTHARIAALVDIWSDRLMPRTRADS
ncbi:MAG: hypothetical protein R2695_05690 [Acidimicrobiales bacterium]